MLKTFKTFFLLSAAAGAAAGFSAPAEARCISRNGVGICAPGCHIVRPARFPGDRFVYWCQNPPHAAPPMMRPPQPMAPNRWPPAPTAMPAAASAAPVSLDWPMLLAIAVGVIGIVVGIWGISAVNRSRAHTDLAFVRRQTTAAELLRHRLDRDAADADAFLDAHIAEAYRRGRQL